MPKFPGFVGGSATDYSSAADNQRTVNFFPELVQSGYGKSRVVLYGTPGLTQKHRLVVLTIIDAGTGYTLGDSLTITSSPGITLTVGSVGGGGQITGLIVSNTSTSTDTSSEGLVRLLIGGTGTDGSVLVNYAAQIKAAFYDTTTKRTFAVARMTAGSSNLFEITGTTAQSHRGQIVATGNQLPASMHTNGTQLFIVDTNTAVIFTYATNVLTDVTASVAGGQPLWGEFLDRYFIALGTNGLIYISALDDGTTWDATDFATPESSPDVAKMLLVAHGELWIFADESIEIWFNSGTADFPLEPIKGATIKQGVVWPYTAQLLNGNPIWVGRSKDGARTVWKANGYTPAPISTHAVEYDLQAITFSTYGGSETAWVYDQGGHSFYVIALPEATAGTKTWVYDSKVPPEISWHERMYLNGSTEEIHRSRCHCYSEGLGGTSITPMHLVGDRANGMVYELSLSTYTDKGDTIRRYRRVPHLANENKFNHFHSFEIEGEYGLAANQRLNLRWSDDGGKTFTGYKEIEVGTAGHANGVTAAAINAAGSGYVVDDILTVAGGTGTAATLRVSTVDGSGAITAILVETPGAYTANPSNPVSVTGGNGTGATFNLTLNTLYFRNRAKWRRLGRARDRVFELKVEDAVKWAITDATLEFTAGDR